MRLSDEAWSVPASPVRCDSALMTPNRIRTLIVLITLLTTMTGVYSAWAEPIAGRDFEDESWSEGLVDLRSIDLVRTRLVNHGFAGRGLEVRIPEGGFRGFGPFDRLPLPEPTEAWYRYHIRLLSWNSASSGKLPGLSGIYSHTAKGCLPSQPGSPGWSARGLFGAAGTEGAPTGHVPIGLYLYHLNLPGSCGEGYYWPGAYLEPGRWHCVEGHVSLNSPGINNGLVEGWFDGTKRFSLNNIAFRRSNEDAVGIREMWLNVYFGGRYPTPNDLSLIIDEVVVSTDGQVGCLDPFTDDNDSLHVRALTELHAVGVLYGCGYRTVCPERQVTRGEVAALFARVMGLPPATRDYFDDDSGSLFEAAINKLAEAGITQGCAAGQFCADRYLTRAEFATMTVRALGLPASGSDAFTDDDGHWAESAINTFADARLTKGCGADRFCPNRALTREEAASFLVRMLDRLQPKRLGLASVNDPLDWPPPGDPPPVPPEEQE